MASRITSKSGNRSSIGNHGSIWGTSSSSPSGRKTRKVGTGSSGIASGYRQVNNMFSSRVQSYRTLCEQTKGAGGKNRPTPSTLKSFANWINKGANICKVTNAQINRWCKPNTTVKSPAACKTVLCSRFGKTAIKAVTCGKTGFIVACAPTVNGKNFKFPK